MRGVGSFFARLSQAQLVVIPLALAVLFSLILVAAAKASGSGVFSAPAPAGDTFAAFQAVSAEDSLREPEPATQQGSEPTETTPGAGGENPPPKGQPSPLPTDLESDQYPSPPPDPSQEPDPRETSAPDETLDPPPPGTDPPSSGPGEEPDARPTVSPSPGPSEQPSNKPNVLVILTDDQRSGTEVVMPTVVKELMGKGVHFPNAVVPTSWCCPSRASLLTGRYSHGTGVWDNTTGVEYGAWPAFVRLGNETRTLTTALKDRGYATGLFGKYLNGLDEAPRGYKAPGWDEFEAMAGSGNGYTEFPTVDGVRHTGTYSTDYFASAAESFIRSVPRGEPVFAYFAPFAPHSPFTAGPYEGAARRQIPALLRHLRWPSPAVGVEGLADMAPWLTAWAQSEYVDRTGLTTEQMITAQADTLMGVDAAVSRLLTALEETGRLENTLVVFMSDNGYSWGEHGLVGKNTPYRSSIEVPLAIRWDAAGLDIGADRRAVAANIDVAATILEAAGAELPKVDGVKLLTRQPKREGVLLEAARWRGERKRPAYCGWRSPDAMYVRYSGGFEELYDYSTDPFELNNVAADPQYERLLKDMRREALLGCFPRPPDFKWGGPDSLQISQGYSAPSDSSARRW